MPKVSFDYFHGNFLNWKFCLLKFILKVDLLKSFSNIFIYYSNVATIGFLCVLCVLLLPLRSCVYCVCFWVLMIVLIFLWLSMCCQKILSCLQFKVHRLLKYMFVFPYVFKMWNMLVARMQSMRPSTWTLYNHAKLKLCYKIHGVATHGSIDIVYYLYD